MAAGGGRHQKTTIQLLVPLIALAIVAIEREPLYLAKVSLSNFLL